MCPRAGFCAKAILFVTCVLYLTKMFIVCEKLELKNRIALVQTCLQYMCGFPRHIFSRCPHHVSSRKVCKSSVISLVRQAPKVHEDCDCGLKRKCLKLTKLMDKGRSHPCLPRHTQVRYPGQGTGPCTMRNIHCIHKRTSNFRIIRQKMV